MDGLKRLLCGRGRVALMAVALVLCASEAWATGSGCANVSPATSGAPPAFTDIVLCVFDTIGVYSVLATLISIIVPLLVIMWGMRSGTALISALYRKAAGALGRH